MLRKKNISFVLLLAVFCCSIVWAEPEMRTITTRDPKTGETITHQVPVAPKEADPYDNTSVLVEAFVVRVSTEALAELDVNSIGQSPEGISILKILACLDDPEKGKVVSGTKLAARNGKHASLNNTERVYVKTERGDSVNYTEFESGKRFDVSVSIETETAVSAEYRYSESSFDETEDDEVPPTTLSNEWMGEVILSTGKAIVAGAAQDDDTITFLILTATIQEPEND
ncbi:MAG: hypothetical protein OEV87_12320 [Phycisphaerae bacterium]|nr:hypothetical protein [Phycisphaerae bacterium]